MSTFKKSFSVFVLLAFLVSTAGFADAAGSSSFSGGSRASSPSSSGFSKSSPSSSFKTSPSPSFNTGSKASVAPAVGSNATKPSSGGSGSWFGFGGGNKAPAATPPPKASESTNLAGPVASPMSKPPAAQTGTFSTSNGSSAGQTKTGSAFGGQDATPAKQPVVNSGNGSSTYAPRSYTPPTPRYDARQYTTYNEKTRTVVIRERPSDWSPRVVVVNRDPSFMNLWWQMELLESIHDMHQREAMMRQMQSDPNYSRWRDEANRLSGENAALKAQLDQVDHPDQVVSAPAPVKAAPVKKSSHWFLWTLLIIGLCVGGYFLLRRK